MTAALGGSLLGVALMGFGALLLSAIPNVGSSSVGLNEWGGTALFVSGSAFLLVSAVVLPALWAIREDRTSPPQ